MDRARICYKAVAYMMQPVVGWNQKMIDCDAEYVSGTFVRDFGTINDFYVVGADLMPGGVVNQKSENEISVRVKLPKVPTHESLDDREQEIAMRDIVSIFQQANMKADIKTANTSVRNGIAGKEIVNVIEVIASSKLIPMEFMKIFSNFNGVYMKSVNWGTDSKTWSYRILIYTK